MFQVGANNGDTLENIRLWDWRALQDTLRQIQEIRTYYDFPDIDIDRYGAGDGVAEDTVRLARFRLAGSELRRPWWKKS